MDRGRKIIQASVINIIGNVLLAATKGVVGMATGSVAITLDAVNSLADALSSVIAITGAKIASRTADHDHPYGFGRVEYLSSIAISAIILAAGISAFVEAIRSIIYPIEPDYSMVALGVVGIAAFVKYALGYYLLSVGKKIESGSLVGSGTDALMDGCVSLATLAAGVLYLTMGWKIESILAAIIAVLITKSGIELLFSTSSKLLGERMDPQVVDKVEREVRAIDEVRFTNGLVLLDFGPDEVAGTVHATVDGNMTVAEFDKVARRIIEHVKKECGVTLAGITPYPDPRTENGTREVRAAVGRIVWGNEQVIELCGLYADPEAQVVRFDVVATFDVVDLEKMRAEIVEECMAACPGWSFDIRVIHHIGD